MRSEHAGNVISNSNRVIEHCGTNAQIVLDAINNKYPYDLAIHQLGEDGVEYIGYGFSAMFKSYNNRDQLKVLLNDMSVLASLPGLYPAPDERLRPIFACVTLQTRQQYPVLFEHFDPAETCKHSRSFIIPRTAYIFICPSFFDLNPTPAIPYERCPRINNNQYTSPDENGFTNAQSYQLVLSLSAFYMGDSRLTSTTQPPVTSNINGAVALNWRDSIRNPYNIMLFTAFVEQGCTEHPDISKWPWGPGLGVSNGSAATNFTFLNSAGTNTSQPGVLALPLEDDPVVQRNQW